MITRVRKWGNSLGMRLTQGILDETGIEVGDSVDISVQEGCLIVKPVKRVGGGVDLAELVGRISVGDGFCRAVGQESAGTAGGAGEVNRQGLGLTGSYGSEQTSGACGRSTPLFRSTSWLSGAAPGTGAGRPERVKAMNPRTAHYFTGQPVI